MPIKVVILCVYVYEKLMSGSAVKIALKCDLHTCGSTFEQSVCSLLCTVLTYKYTNGFGLKAKNVH